MADRVRQQAIPREIGHPRQLALAHRPAGMATDPVHGGSLNEAMNRTGASISRPALPSVAAPMTRTGPAAPVTSDSPERHGSDHVRVGFPGRERLASLQPQFGAIAHRLASALPRPQTVEIIDSFAAPFAMQAQCAFLGQSVDVEAALRYWIRPCQARIFCGDDHRSGKNSSEMFEARLEAVLQARRTSAASSPRDVIDALICEQGAGQAPGDHELLGILHDWTAGAVNEITRVLRMIVRDLAEHTERQADLRAESGRLARMVAASLRAIGHEPDRSLDAHWAFGENPRAWWLSRPPMPVDGSDWQYRSGPSHDVRLWSHVLQLQLHEAVRALLTRLDHFEPASIRTSRVGRCSTSRYPTLPLRIR